MIPATFCHATFCRTLKMLNEESVKQQATSNKQQATSNKQGVNNMKKEKQKYWLCEFFKRYGEDENNYYYVYSDKNLKDMGYENDEDDYKILSQFFLNKITPDDQDGSDYWHFDSLVRFDGMQEVKPKEFKTLQKAGVYVNGDNLMFNYESATS